MRMTRLVVSFNRHFFALAICSAVAGLVLAALLESWPLKAILIVGAGLAVYFMVASVLASYWVYDASDLYRLRWWPDRALAGPPTNAVLVHAGFDPASRALRVKFPGMRLRILDFFDPRETTEASIQRAHRLFPPSPEEEAVASGSWPVPAGSQDAVFILSAAHELRRDEERAAFFREARRVLRAGGRVVVIEQLRDWHNFACFGLAAFHFLSRRTWFDSFRAGGLAVADEFAITPFMRAFVLR